MTFSLTLNDQDSRLLEDYARLNNITVSEFIHQAILERIEDEYDLACYKKALKEYNDNPVTYSLEDIEKELGLR